MIVEIGVMRQGVKVMTFPFCHLLAQRYNWNSSNGYCKDPNQYLFPFKVSKDVVSATNTNFFVRTRNVSQNDGNVMVSMIVEIVVMNLKVFAMVTTCNKKKHLFLIFY